jgi:diketogulonate reductase-like aldo/keto reductase
MATITLNNNVKMPAIGLGTWRATPDDVAESAVETAINSGYRHIDGAKAYGNEAGVGRGIAKAIKNGVASREELFVVTKLFNDDHRRVEDACRLSLQKLGLDYLDLYLVHWPCTFETGEELKPSYEETWREMEKLVEKGLVKTIGVSNMTAKKLKDLLSYAKIKPAVNQIEIHPYWRNETTIKFCQENDIHTTAYSPLGSVAATGEAGGPVVIKDPVVTQIAQEVNKAPAQVLLRWLLQNGHSAAPKARSPEHIKGNIDVFDFELSADAMSKLSQLKHQGRTCTGDIFLNKDGPYRTLEDLWDGEGY